MYARRQRRVQSASTNVQTLVLTTLNPDEILSANLISYPDIEDKVSSYTAAKVAERPRGCLQSNYTPVQIRTLAFGDVCHHIRHFVEVPALRNKASKSKHVVIAAIAFGTHLVSFRTQKLSRNT